MLLYYYPGACSLAPHIVLRETGIPHELRKVDLHSRQVEGGGNFLEVNPKGYVPALRLDSGEVLTEAPAILLYLADQRPQAGLVPAAGSIERYRVIEWLSFASSELHKSFSPLFNPGAAAEWKAGAKAALEKRLGWVDGELAKRSYLVGDRFSVADAYLFVILTWSEHVGLDLARWASAASFVKRIGARPQVLAALRAEGLAK